MSRSARKWSRRACLAAAVLLFVSACRAPPASRTSVAAATGPAGATHYRLDATATQLWLYLRADGPLARLGHSHVITTQALQGDIWLHPQLERSGCAFQLPVAGLVVDDPQQRASTGGEFGQPLDDEARTGTRDHMLGERQLDASRFPSIDLRCTAVRATADGAELTLTATLRGREASLVVPVHWQQSAGVLRASGEFNFRQSDLGLEPYSALLGALRVADRIDARLNIVARIP
jgi:polyisoprenoid-binding protein YceI